MKVTSPGAQLVLIRRWLSLDVVGVARVLGVEPATVHAWTGHAKAPTADERGRISALYEIARFRREHAGSAERTAPPTAAEIARANGFSPLSERMQRRALDHETRFRRPAGRAG